MFHDTMLLFLLVLYFSISAADQKFYQVVASGNFEITQMGLINIFILHNINDFANGQNDRTVVKQILHQAGLPHCEVNFIARVKGQATKPEDNPQYDPLLIEMTTMNCHTQMMQKAAKDKIGHAVPTLRIYTWHEEKEQNNKANVIVQIGD